MTRRQPRAVRAGNRAYGLSERAKTVIAFTMAGIIMLIVATAVMAVMWHLEPSAVVVRQSSCTAT